MTPEAKAREIAERHGWDRVRECRYDIALIEALLFQPLPEWSETMDSSNDCPIHGEANNLIGMCCIPAKPGELPEWALRKACEELNVDVGIQTYRYPESRSYTNVRTVARLLVRIKELEGPKEDPLAHLEEALLIFHGAWGEENWPGTVMLERRLRAEMARLQADAAKPKEDPDLVLAREMAARGDYVTASGSDDIRSGSWDENEAVQSALRTIKHLRDAGWKEG